MKLVYKSNGIEVKPGDHVALGVVPTHVVVFIDPPKHPGLPGKVYVRPTHDSECAPHGYYPVMIGAHWQENGDAASHRNEVPRAD